MSLSRSTARIDQLFFPPICAACLTHPAKAGFRFCRACTQTLPAISEPHCSGCGGTLDGVLELCSECLQNKRPWKFAVSVWDFGGTARQLIHRFKYRGDVALSRPLAALAADAWNERYPGPPPDLVTAIPLHWTRRIRRGYNQAELLAREFGIRQKLPWQGLLRRCHATGSQARLTRAQRQKNLKNAFVCRESIQGAEVLLIDDVLTTGATLSAATRALLQAGAENVYILTLARD